VRITVDSSDPDFIGRENLGQYNIWLDGKRVEGCFAADDVMGYVITDIRDPAGNVLFNRLWGTIKTQMLFGEVRIIDTRKLLVA
jgi:hypothetical protein